MLARPQVEYASEVWNPHTMKCIKKIGQIQRNSSRFIFHEYRRDTDTSLLINRSNLDSLYTHRLIQQATMVNKIHYNLVDICPPSCKQPANHISSRTDHPLRYCNKKPLQINAYKYSFFSCSMNVWNRLPFSAVTNSTALAGQHLIRCRTVVANRLFNTDLSDHARNLLFSVNLTALHKDEGIRPIAVGNIFCSLASKVDCGA